MIKFSVVDPDMNYKYHSTKSQPNDLNIFTIDGCTCSGNGKVKW